MGCTAEVPAWLLQREHQRGGSGNPGWGCSGPGGMGKSTGIFRVGEWTFCKKPVSAMMSRGQRKLRLT